jgi:hypothetical protein
MYLHISIFYILSTILNTIYKHTHQMLKTILTSIEALT